MIAWNGPSLGAGRFLVKGSGWGSACVRACRTVFRECPNWRAIWRMDMPSR